MTSCWNADPEQRPSFEELVDKLSVLLEEEKVAGTYTCKLIVPILSINNTQHLSCKWTVFISITTANLFKPSFLAVYLF